MFAYAIWDSRNRSLLLVRDRFGKKPLYFAALPQGLYFGSELKCLRLPGIPLEIDRQALQLYFAINYVPDPWSSYQSIRKLTPGGWLRYDADGKLEEGRYWKLPAPAEEAAPGIHRAGRLRSVRETFDESVRLRLISDVPLGAFLSGGIDSTSVVASMTMQTKEPVKTFSIGFEEPEFNELSLAAAVARKYKTDHHEIIVRPNSIDLVSKLVQHFDEPFSRFLRYSNLPGIRICRPACEGGAHRRRRRRAVRRLREFLRHPADAPHGPRSAQRAERSLSFPSCFLIQPTGRTTCG